MRSRVPRACLAHGLLYVGKGNLAYIQEQTDQNQPDSWKGYNISNAAKVDNDPKSLMRQWRHDDEEVAYPTFELIEKIYRKLKSKKPGFNNICVHKGLAPGPPDPVRGHPGDLPKAAKDWPNLNFITYHACIQPAMFLYDSLQEVRSGKTARRRTRHQLDHGVRRARGAVQEHLRRDRNNVGFVGRDVPHGGGAHPGSAHEVHGTGSHRLRFGLGLVRIAAVADRRVLAIPDPGGDAEEVRLPGTHAGRETEDSGAEFCQALRHQRQSRTVTLSRRFKPVPKDYETRMSKELKTILEFPGFTADGMAKLKDEYVANGAEPSHIRYGWVRTKA